MRRKNSSILFLLILFFIISNEKNIFIFFIVFFEKVNARSCIIKEKIKNKFTSNADDIVLYLYIIL